MKWNIAKSGRLLRKAADIMNDKGYTTGTLQDSSGFCVRGAVNYAWSGNSRITMESEYICRPYLRNKEVVQTLNHFAVYLFENKLAPYRGVEDFNDKTRDKDEVIRWMRKFADEVDPQK